MLVVSTTAQSYKPAIQNVTQANKSDTSTLIQDNPISNVSEEVTKSCDEKAAEGHTESFINRTLDRLEGCNPPVDPAVSDTLGGKKEGACTELLQSPPLKLNNTVNEVRIQRVSVCDVNLVTQFILLFPTTKSKDKPFGDSTTCSMTLGGKNFGEICAILVHDDPGFGIDVPEECWTSIIENVLAVDVRHWDKCKEIANPNYYCHLDEIIQWRGSDVADAMRRKWDESRSLPGNDTAPCASQLPAPQPVIPVPTVVRSDSEEESEESNHRSGKTLPIVTGILMLMIVVVVLYYKRRKRVENDDLNCYIAVQSPVEEGVA